MKRTLRLPPVRPAALAVALLAVAAPLGLAFAVAQWHRPFRLEAIIRTAGVDLEAGRAVFIQHCQVCHPVGRGQEGSCPNLGSIGRTGGSRRPGMDAAHYILESILTPSAYRPPESRGVMPEYIASGLSTEQIRELVAYLATRDAHPDLRAIARMSIPPPPADARPHTVVRREQIERGLEVFEHKAGCGNCHTLHPERKYYQLIAPPLFLASSFEDAYIAESIRDPSKTIVSGFETVHVATADGRVFTGRLLRQTPDALVLLSVDAQGNSRPIHLALDQVEKNDDGTPAIARTGLSPMPQGFGELLTQEDIEAVIALLKCWN